MIELIIVMAIISIIGAIVLPNFTNTTDKARIKSDIQSARIIQDAVDLYNAEMDTPLPKTSLSNDISTLKETNYLKSNMAGIQTQGAVWKYTDTDKVRVDVGGCTAKIKEICAELTTSEQSMLIGITITAEGNSNE